MRKVNYLVAFLVFCCLRSGAQNDHPFYVYYDPGRYTDSVKHIMEKQTQFKPYYLMVQSRIDPKRTGGIDKDIFVSNIRKIYKDSLQSGVISIDLENAVFTNLFKFKKESTDYQQSADVFIWMVNTIKSMRPNVKVGIYGLPFRAFYPQSKEPDPVKLDGVLSVCDFIFPSLYTMYPNAQIGSPRNQQYYTENLQAAMDYGVRLKKPVVPFVWTVVHPSNKQYGGQLMDKNEFNGLIAFIKNYTYKGVKPAGIVVWDPDPNYFATTVKMPANRMAARAESDKDPKAPVSQVFYDYMQPFMDHR